MSQETATPAAEEIESNSVDALVEQLTSQEKQNAETIFSPPPRPAFIVDEEPEAEIYDIEEEEPGAEAFVGAKTGKGINAEFYAGGFVDFLSWIMASFLGWLNETDPEQYEIDPFEEKELIESSAAMMQSSGRKFTPGQRLSLAAIIIWGKPLAAGLWNKGKKLGQWFNKRKKAEISPAPPNAISETPAAPAGTVTLTETEAKELFEQMKAEALKAAKAEAANKPTAKAPKAEGANKRETQKAAPITPFTLAPTLAELKEKQAAGLCLYPGCATATKGKFCGNDHRLAYTREHNRTGSQWPSSKEI